MNEAESKTNEERTSNHVDNSNGKDKQSLKTRIGDYHSNRIDEIYTLDEKNSFEHR